MRGRQNFEMSVMMRGGINKTEVGTKKVTLLEV